MLEQNPHIASDGTYQTAATSRGAFNSTVSSQWYKRTADETFASLSDLKAFTQKRFNVSDSKLLNTHDMNVVGDVDELNPTRGDITIKSDTGVHTPTNWAFGQLSRLAGAPASYLQDLPAPLVADNLNWGLRYNREKEQILELVSDSDSARAYTGPDYGRIWHHEIVDTIDSMNQRTGNRFKIPGKIDWSRRSDNGTVTYDPNATADSTLYASDRDMFGFLCDDRNPIEIGKLDNGKPDLLFRGFYFWNSEEGSRTAGVAAFYLRGICENRCLWGVENFQEMKIRHTKFASDRFAAEATPALESFCEGSSSDLVAGVEKAKAAIVAHDNDSMLAFLNKRAGLSRKQATAAIARHVEEENKEPRSVWDMAQAITAIARDVPNQDTRVGLEKTAGAILDKVAA